MIQHLDLGPRMSQASIHGNVVYLAGQVADDASAGVTGQTAQVLAAIRRHVGKPLDQAPTPQQQCLGRHHAPEATADRTPHPTHFPDWKEMPAAAVNAAVRKIFEHPISGCPMHANRTRASRPLMREHPIHVPRLRAPAGRPSPLNRHRRHHPIPFVLAGDAAAGGSMTDGRLIE